MLDRYHCFQTTARRRRRIHLSRRRRIVGVWQKPKVRPPTEQVGGQLSHHSATLTPRTRRVSIRTRFRNRNPRRGGHTPLRPRTRGEAEAQKRQHPGRRHRTLCHVDLELEPPGDEACEGLPSHAVPPARFGHTRCSRPRSAQSGAPGVPARCQGRGARCSTSTGDSGPPCGVPSSVTLTRPPPRPRRSGTPRTSLSTRVSRTYWASRPIKRS